MPAFVWARQVLNDGWMFCEMNKRFQDFYGVEEGIVLFSLKIVPIDSLGTLHKKGPIPYTGENKIKLLT